MRRSLVVATLVLSLLTIVTTAARADKWCDPTSADTRTPQQKLPQQAVVEVHHTAQGNHYVAGGIGDDGRLTSIDLDGHDGYTPLISAWQTPAVCVSPIGPLRTGAWAATPAGHVYTDGAVAGQ